MKSSPAVSIVVLGLLGLAAAPATAGPAQLAQAGERASYSIRNLQRVLNDLGYAAGPEDGLMGGKTRAAIRAYQRASNLLVTGAPSYSLYTHAQATLAERVTASTRPAAASTDMVIRIQSALRSRGYDVPAITGRSDAATRRAIAAFQRDAGLAATGAPSAALLTRLERAPAEARPAAGPLARHAVARIQRQLNDRGYDAGPADGALGPKTRSAIRTYQSDAGLPITGQASAALLARLDSDRGERQPDPDKPDPRRRVVSLDDDFADGDYRYNPAWTVNSGAFTVTDGALTSRVEPEAPSQPQNLKPEEVGKLFLRELLTAALSDPRQASTDTGAAAGQSARAQISTRTPIANAFRLRLRLSSRINDGRLVLGPYSGSEKTGYRIAYASGERPSFELLSVTDGGVRVIETSDKMINLEDGNPHTLEWRRNARGRMVVLADGNEVMRARDAAIAGDFDGFTMINAGGEYAVHRVRIVSRGSKDRAARR